MPIKKLNILSSVITASLLLTACDSELYTPESAEVDIVPITDAEGNILNLLTMRATAVGDCGTSAYSISKATSPDDHDDNYAPARAIDGDLGQTSRWSSKGSGRSITFDLGSTKTVDRIQTAWYKGNIRSAYFDVDTSVNGSSWTSVLSSASAGGSLGLIAFDVQSTDARYVKIIGQGNSDSAWNSLVEAEVYGCGSTDTPDTPDAPDGANIVSNGTFENGLNDWVQVEPAFQSGVTYAGSGSAKVEGSGSISQTLLVDTNTSYKGSAQVRGKGRIGVNVGGITVDNYGTSDDYDLVEFEFNSGSASSVKVFADSNSGTVRIDNFEVSEGGGVQGGGGGGGGDVPGSANKNINVVFNGTFEDSLSGWAQIEPAQGSARTYEGIGAGKIYESGSVSQSVFVEPLSRYRATAFIEGDPTVSVTVDGNTYSVTGKDTECSNCGNGEEYVEVSFEFDTGSADVARLSVKASSSTNESRVDNFEVFKISDNITVGDPPIDPNTVFDFSIWDVEGESPITRDGLLAFDALEQCVITPNGNGCRHEQKIQQSERYGLTEQYERFSANIEAQLSPGSETIVVQHHPEATGTLAAMYISDTALKNVYTKVENGIAADGIFDVYVTVRIPDTIDNEVVVLGTIRSGEAFNYEVINDHGEITMTGLGTTATATSADSSASYLKFGNYQQARDAYTRDRLELVKPHTAEARDTFLDYYASKGFTESKVTFRDVSYKRTID